MSREENPIGAEIQPEADLLVPKTRIASLFVGMNLVAAFMVAVTAALGPLIQYNDTLFWFHLTSGLGAAVLGLFGLVSAMFYLVVSGMGIREAVAANKLPFELFARTRQFKKELFPWCVGAIVLLITMTVLGGGVHVKKIHKYYHLAFSILTIAVYIGAIVKMKSCYARNAGLIAETLGAMDKKNAG
jgi:hypothetical protein